MLKSLLIAIGIITVPVVVFLLGGYLGQDVLGNNHARIACDKWAEVEVVGGRTVTPEAMELCQVENFNPAFGAGGFITLFIMLLLSGVIALITWGINDLRKEKKREKEYDEKWGIK